MVYLIWFFIVLTALLLWLKRPAHELMRRRARACMRRRIKNLYDVVEYVLDKYIDGLSVGVMFLLFAPLDKSAKFASSVDDLLTSLNPAIVLFGWLCASTYICIRWFYPAEVGFRLVVLRVVKSWFDLVQQFFVLALGAFLPIKICLVLTKSPFKDFRGEINKHEVAFIATLFFAFLFAGLWILKDRVPRRKDGSGPTTNYKWLFGLNLLFITVLVTLFFVDERATSTTVERFGADVVRWLHSKIG